jgi:hypothetical protein
MGESAEEEKMSRGKDRYLSLPFQYSATSLKFNDSHK